MAGSVTKHNVYANRIRSLVYEWTCDASGDVSGSTTEVNLPGGSLYTFLSVPKSGVTDAFDVTMSAKMTLPNGNTVTVADVLGGQGGNLSNSTNGEWEFLNTPFPMMFDTRLALTIANAGNAQSGTLIFFIRDDLY